VLRERRRRLPGEAGGRLQRRRQRLVALAGDLLHVGGAHPGGAGVVFADEEDPGAVGHASSAARAGRRERSSALARTSTVWWTTGSPGNSLSSATARP